MEANETPHKNRAAQLQPHITFVTSGTKNLAGEKKIVYIIRSDKEYHYSTIIYHSPPSSMRLKGRTYCRVWPYGGGARVLPEMGGPPAFGKGG